MSGESFLAPSDLTSPPQGARRSLITDDLLQQAGQASDADSHQDILDAVVLANRGVAESLARRYRGRGIDEDDLTQVAYEALVKAVTRFDSGRDRDLLAYAVPTIRGELQRHFRDHGWVVRPTRTVQENQWRIAKSQQSLAQELGHPPDRAEVLEALDITGAQYDEAMTASGCFQPTSLDQTIGADDSTSLGDVIPELDDGFEAAEARLMLEPVLRRLTPRQRRVLQLRFHEGRTQAEIGTEVGITQTQVSRVLNDVMGTLRDALV